MDLQELTDLEQMGPTELIFEYENQVIDLMTGATGAGLDRIREIRRIIVRRLRQADRAASALT